MTGQTGNQGSFYWIKCWDRKKPFKRRQYYYTFMHSNGQVLATSEGIHNKKDRDEVVRGLLRDKLQMITWVDGDGVEVNREFMVN